MENITDEKDKEILLQALENSKDGFLVIPKEMKYLDKNLGDLILKYGIKTITFEPDSQLQKVLEKTFETNQILQKIDFSNCKDLNGIGAVAFWRCSNLSEVIFAEENNLKVLGVNCLSYTAIKELKLNKSTLETIKFGAFRFCQNLKIVDFSGCENLTTIERSVFNGDDFDILDFSNNSNLKSFGHTIFNSKICKFNYNVEGVSNRIRTNIRKGTIEVYDNGKKQFEFGTDDELSKLDILHLSYLKFSKRLGFDISPNILNFFENKKELKFALDNYDRISTLTKQMTNDERLIPYAWYWLKYLGYLGFENTNFENGTKSEIEAYKNLLAKNFLKFNMPEDLQKIEEKDIYYQKLQERTNKLAKKMSGTELVEAFIKDNFINHPDKEKLLYQLAFFYKNKKANLKFSQFFVYNFDEIMEKKIKPIKINYRKNYYDEFEGVKDDFINFSSIQNNFDKMLSNTNKKIITRKDKQRLTLDDLKFKNIYPNVYPENKELAELCGRAHIKQEDFDKLQNYFNKGKEIKDKQVLQCVKDNPEEDWNYEIIEKDNPLGFVLGNITNCCQAIGARGADCMISGVKNPNSTFAIFKFKDKIIGQSWLWYDKKTNTIALDNIEVPEIYKKSINSSNSVEVDKCLKRLCNNLFNTMTDKGYKIDNIIIGASNTDFDFLEDKYYKETDDKKMIKCEMFVEGRLCYSDVSKKGQFIIYKDGKPFEMAKSSCEEMTL